MPEVYLPSFWLVVYIPVALLGAWGIGRLFHIVGNAERIFVGLGLNSALLVPLSIVQPVWVAIASASITAVGLSQIVLKFSPVLYSYRHLLFASSRAGIRSKLHQNNSLDMAESKRYIPWLYLRSSAFALVCSAWLFPGLYTFETHDLLYFGWLPAILTSGNLLVDFAYPMKMGISNSMPSLFLVPLAFPGEAATFVDFVFIRASVVYVFIFLIVNRLQSLQSSSTKLPIFGAIGLALIFWGSEWSYTLLISSFVPAIGLALVALASIRGSTDRNTVFLIFALVAISKAPIAGVAVATLLFLAISRRYRPQVSILVTGALVCFATLITWLTAERGSSARGANFTFMGIGITEGNDGAQISWRLYDWAASFTALPGWIVDYSATAVRANLGSMPPTVLVILSACAIIWVLCKYFLVYALVRTRSSGALKNGVGPLDIYVSCALLSFMFVRNGDEVLWIGHQAHAFILVGIPTSLLVVQFLLQTNAFRHAKATVNWMRVLAAVLVGLISSSSPIFSRLQSESAISFQTARIEYLQLDKLNSVIYSDSVNYSRLQVIAAISGTKFRYSPNSNSSSQVDDFLLVP